MQERLRHARWRLQRRWVAVVVVAEIVAVEPVVVVVVVVVAAPAVAAAPSAEPRKFDPWKALA